MASIIPRLIKQRSETLARTLFKLDGYCKYGLYHDDLIGGVVKENDPQVAEALRRLSIDNPEVYDQFVFRSLSAVQLRINNKILPPEKWTTFEEDNTKGNYLQPYLAQIREEEKEKTDFMLLD